MIEKSTGAKTSRSETVSIRLDPKIHFLAELSATANNRTLSGFIEWCVRRALATGVPVTDINMTGASSDHIQPATHWGDDLWHYDEIERFVKVATKRPDLMTDADRALWNIVKHDERYRIADGYNCNLLRRDWSKLCEKVTSVEATNFRAELKRTFANALESRRQSVSQAMQATAEKSKKGK